MVRVFRTFILGHFSHPATQPNDLAKFLRRHLKHHGQSQRMFMQSTSTRRSELLIEGNMCAMLSLGGSVRFVQE